MDTLFKATIPSKCNNFFNLVNYTLPLISDWLYVFFSELFEIRGKHFDCFEDLINLYTKDFIMVQSLRNYNVDSIYNETTSTITLIFKRSNVHIYIRKIDENYEVYADIESLMDIDKLKPICEYLEKTEYFQQASCEMFCKQDDENIVTDVNEDIKVDIPSVVISKSCKGFVTLYRELRDLDKDYFKSLIDFIEEYYIDSIDDFARCAKENRKISFDIVDSSNINPDKVVIDFRSETRFGIHNYRLIVENDDKTKTTIINILSGLLHKDFNNLNKYFYNGWNIERSYVYMNDEED